MRRSRVVFATISAGAIALAATWSGANAASDIQLDPKAPWTVWVDGNRSTQAQAYKAAHPDLHITIDVVDAFQGSNTSKIALAEKAGSGIPDVIFLDPQLHRVHSHHLDLAGLPVVRRIDGDLGRGPRPGEQHLVDQPARVLLRDRSVELRTRLGAGDAAPGVCVALAVVIITKTKCYSVGDR